MTATSASVQFTSGGVVEVQSSLRLTGNTWINCYTYDDHAPILGIDDAHVKVSITVPDTSHVTADDVTWARLLAEAVARYVTELEQLAVNRESPADPGAASGQAA
ncbi:MAG: hypothetical protein ACLP8X_12350 [Streptosporangiaceae bacterium]